jgi:AcrR family transcriptional regulator
MDEHVKPAPARRRYNAPRRQAAAAITRRDIISAAKHLFVERGYAATTMAAIAEAAGVSHETVYATFGPKPTLFRYLVETALSGTDEPVPALERDIVRQVRAEPDPGRILELFAHTVRLLHQRLAPLFEVLSDGARTDPDLKAFADELSSRRVGHMRAFVADLTAKGGLRQDVSIELATDMIWAMNSSQFYLLYVRDRGWTPEVFEHWLADAWKRLLLPLSAPADHANDESSA